MALCLMFEDILWNLDTICRITSHKTLLVTGDRLSLDDRALQAFRRPFTADGRESILSAIAKTLRMYDELVCNYSFSLYLNPPPQVTYLQQRSVAEVMLGQLTDLVHRRTSIAEGLKTLATFERYIHDTSFQIKAHGFVAQFERLADRAANLRQEASTRVERTTYRLFMDSASHQREQSLPDEKV